MLSIKEYSEQEKISLQAVYKRIKAGKIETVETQEGLKVVVELLNQNIKPSLKEVENQEPLDKYRLEIKYLKEQVESQFKQIEELKKEKNDLKFQVKDKDFEIKSLLEKMENLNDRVIGLIEWKNKSWWNKIFK